jgi:hypothetical protein
MTAAGVAAIVAVMTNTAPPTTCSAPAIRHSWRRRWLGVLTAVLLAAGLVAAAGSPAQAQSQTLTVPSGGSVRLCTDCTPIASADISPPGAGTASYVMGSGLYFFASSAASYVGTTVTIDQLMFGTTGYANQVFTVTITPGGSSTQFLATFTPVAAPGPCVVLSATTASFGNVELGGSWTVMPNPPTLSGCSTIRQDVLMGASPVYETGSTAPFLQHALCSVYTSCAPAANQVALGLPATERIVPQLPARAVALSDLAGGFAATPIALALRLPSQIPATSAELYLNVQLIAMAAS